MVTATYPKNLHQDDFDTSAASAKQLGSPRTMTAKKA
jgi:hypothetical protein